MLFTKCFSSNSALRASKEISVLLLLSKFLQFSRRLKFSLKNSCYRDVGGSGRYIVRSEQACARFKLQFVCVCVCVCVWLRILRTA